MTMQRTPAALFFSALCGLCQAGDSFSGLVIDVVDGETLTIVDERSIRHEVRLFGIKVPKLNQPFGDKSTANLGALAFGHEANADCRGKEPGGRDLCVLMVEGVDIGLVQIKQGMAANVSDTNFNAWAPYEAAEGSARLSRRGIWSEPGGLRFVSEKTETSLPSAAR